MRLSSVKIWLGSILTALGFMAAYQPVMALPSFARQTGMSCSACHTALSRINHLWPQFQAQRLYPQQFQNRSRTAPMKPAIAYRSATPRPSRSCCRWRTLS